MNFLDTQHKRKSMTITVILHVILLILLVFVGMMYLDRALGGGIAMIFGISDQGSGKIQHTEKIQAAPHPYSSQATSQPRTEIKGEVVTQENDGAPIIKKEEAKEEQ